MSFNESQTSQFRPCQLGQMSACSQSCYFFHISLLSFQGHHPPCSLNTFYLEHPQTCEFSFLTLKAPHLGGRPPHRSQVRLLPPSIPLPHCFFFLLAGLSNTSILPLPPSALGSFMLSTVTSEGVQSSSSDSELSAELSGELSSELSSSFEADRFISNKATSCKKCQVENSTSGQFCHVF